MKAKRIICVVTMVCAVAAVSVSLLADGMQGKLLKEAQQEFGRARNLMEEFRAKPVPQKEEKTKSGADSKLARIDYERISFLTPSNLSRVRSQSNGFSASNASGFRILITNDDPSLIPEDYSTICLEVAEKKSKAGLTSAGMAQQEATARYKDVIKKFSDLSDEDRLLQMMEASSKGLADAKDEEAAVMQYSLLMAKHGSFGPAADGYLIPRAEGKIYAFPIIGASDKDKIRAFFLACFDEEGNEKWHGGITLPQEMIGKSEEKVLNLLLGQPKPEEPASSSDRRRERRRRETRGGRGKSGVKPK